MIDFAPNCMHRTPSWDEPDFNDNNTTERMLAQACNHNVHIAIDLSGFWSGSHSHSHLQALHQKMAPIQVSLMGHLSGMGGLVDLIVTDSYAYPPDNAPFYDEKPAYLPFSFHPIALDAWPLMQDMDTTSSTFTLGFFNELLKMNAQMFTVIAAAMQRVLHSHAVRLVMMLNHHEQMPQKAFTIAQSIMAEAASRGCAADQLQFVKPLPAVLHSLRMASMPDLCLDSTTLQGGRTSLDYLASAVPLVTMPRVTINRRIGGSLYRALGIHSEAEPGLIPDTLKGYEDAIFGFVTGTAELNRGPAG